MNTRQESEGINVWSCSTLIHVMNDMMQKVCSGNSDAHPDFVGLRCRIGCADESRARLAEGYYDQFIPEPGKRG